jgi:hypothetical protein
MATFKAAGTFQLRSRESVVIYGDILSGEVRSGMCVVLPTSPGASMTRTIAAVEFVDRLLQQRSYVGLVIHCVDAQEQRFWDALNIADEELEVLPSELR